MSLLKEIKEQLKLKAVGVNLSNKRQDAIAAFIDAKVTTVEEIEAALGTYAEYRPFAEIAKEDDRERLAETKLAQEKEVARLKAIADGKPAPVEVDPNETATDKMLRLLLERQEKQDAAIASMLGEKVTSSRKDQYAKALEGTSETFKAKALKDFSKMQFQSDDEFTEFLTESQSDAAAFIQETSNSTLGGDRITAGQGGAGFNKEASKAEVDSLLKNIM